MDLSTFLIMGHRLADGGVITVVVVLAAALVLFMIRRAFKITQNGGSTAVKTVQAAPAPKAAAAVLQSAVETKPSAKQEEKFDEELVAVITAAINAANYGSQSKLVVKSIKRVPDHGTGWNRPSFLDQI